MQGDRDGKALRAIAPRRSHGEWEPPADRGDPVAILRAADAVRVPELVAVRYERMLASPFAFYRGAAAVMAADLASTPATGVLAQCCGDAHPANFGLFATPERRLVFSVNDFDETLVAPWEWDVKRLAAGAAVAAGAASLDETTVRSVAVSVAQEYRRRVTEYAMMSMLAVWYSTIDVRECVRVMRASLGDDTQRVVARARRHHHLHAVGRLTEIVDGRTQFRDVPPLLCRLDDDPAARDEARAVLTQYATTLPEERRVLLERFELVDVARKVVGVGSVGTNCWVALFEHRNVGAVLDPLVLQIKQATVAVLEPFAGPSTHRHHGQRVVAGQRAMQAFPDIFLGWATIPAGRSYYVRQLEDMKGGFELMRLDSRALDAYVRLCAWSLARAHARTANAVLIADYLGAGDQFDQAIGEFAVRYSVQNGRDYEALQNAAARGRLPIGRS